VELLTQPHEIRDLRDLQDGNPVDQVLLVRNHELRHTRAGADYIRLSLADRTGVVTGMVWEDLEHASSTARAGEAVLVTGVFSEHPRYGRQVTVRALQRPEHVDWDRLTHAPATAVAELERELDTLLHSLQDYHLRALTNALLGAASTTGRSFRRASPPSTTTTHTARGCSSTRCRSRTPQQRPPRSSPASTGTWPCAAHCCTTSASSTPTPAITTP
jgi:DNA polymerase III alpha subunit